MTIYIAMYLFRLSSLLGSFATYSRLRGPNDDDWVDRISHLYTVVILAIFALFVTTSQFVGDPIQCWCPAEFSSSFIAYTKHYCWISNTYYIPIFDVIPTNIVVRREEELTYYQWIPIILLFQALLFKLPNILWRLFNGSSGINLDKIVTLTAVTQVDEPEKRDKTVHHIALYLDRWLELHREYKWNLRIRIRQKFSKLFCFCVGKRDGTFLTGFYLFVKSAYLANVAGQFYIMNGFMGSFYSFYGFELMNSLASEEEWQESKRFPRVTLCDFEIRQLQNIQRYTVQCVLPINLFNEKIFIFLWFWFVAVATITAANFLCWVYRIFFRMNRSKYIKKYLKMLNQINSKNDKKLCQKFAEQYLRDDGIFVLRLVSKNSNDLLLTELIHQLWILYRDKPLIKKTIIEDDETLA